MLTEAERIQRREENARRRKRQTEQRLQDEQVSFLPKDPQGPEGSRGAGQYPKPLPGMQRHKIGAELFDPRTKRSIACYVRKRRNHAPNSMPPPPPLAPALGQGLGQRRRLDRN